MLRFLLVIVIAVPFSAAAQDTAPAVDVITLAAVGDIMMGSDYPDPKLPPEDGKGIFDSVKHILQGHDIVFGNLEGPLLDSRNESTKCRTRGSCYAFRTPTRYVEHLKEAGFTALGIANNHASDFGEEGRESTIDALESAGIRPVGGPLIARSLVKGRKIAVAGFSFSTSTPYSYSILDIKEAQRIVEGLKRDNDLVIISFHGGAEGIYAQRLYKGPEKFLGEDRGDVIRFSRAVVDAGADMVIGHGPHVLRAIEIYKGRLIAYSLGNFLTYARFNIRGPSGIGAVLQASLDARTGAFMAGRLVPVRLLNEGVPEPDPERRGISLMRRLTRQDIPSPRIEIMDDGAILIDVANRTRTGQGTAKVR